MWLVTGDSRVKSEQIAYQSGIFSHSRNTYNFDKIVEDEVEFNIIKMARLSNTDFVFSTDVILTLRETVEYDPLLRSQLE